MDRRALILVLALVGACSSSGETDDNNAANNVAANNMTPNNVAPNNVAANNVAANAQQNNAPDGALTYWSDLRPLMDTHCVGCHDGQGVAPYDFTNPQEVVSLAELIRVNVENKIMPPWYPEDEDCLPLQGDPRVSDDGIAAFGQWVDDGKWIGDELNYVAGEVIPADIGVARLVNDEVIALEPPAEYEVPSTYSDDFRCFTIDPEFQTDRFVSGYEVNVDNADILHHMVLFAIAPGNDQALADLEAEDTEPGFACFGSPGVDDIALVGAWAPGGGRVGFPQGTALPVEAGTKFVMQMHYNIDNGTGFDASTVSLWLMPEGQDPLSEANETFIGNLPFQIPPGVNGLDVPDEECEVVYSVGDGFAGLPAKGIASGDGMVGSNGCVVQEFYYNLDVPLRVWSAFPHMHNTGTTIKIEIEPVVEQDGVLVAQADDDSCLMDMPRWDFNWQRAYWLEEPVRVPTSGVVRLTCRYDNSDGTSAVNLGDGSNDEMCLGMLYLSL